MISIGNSLVSSPSNGVVVEASVASRIDLCSQSQYSLCLFIPLVMEKQTEAIEIMSEREASSVDKRLWMHW